MVACKSDRFAGGVVCPTNITGMRMVFCGPIAFDNAAANTVMLLPERATAPFKWRPVTRTWSPVLSARGSLAKCKAYRVSGPDHKKCR